MLYMLGRMPERAWTPSVQTYRVIGEVRMHLRQHNKAMLGFLTEVSAKKRDESGKLCFFMTFLQNRSNTFSFELLKFWHIILASVSIERTQVVIQIVYSQE